MFTVIICILVVSKITTAQIPSVGSCPNVETVQHFDVARYLGKWFEMERYFAIFELGGKCVTAEYSLHDNGTVHVRNQQLQFYTEAQTTIDGTARLASNTGEAKLLVTFPSLPVAFDAPYWVVETDYDSYSVVWSCVDLSILNFQNAWILTRERVPSTATMEKAYMALKKQNISRTYFLKTNQANCPHT
ncbi:apolipoprotein D-like [Diorhabda sublineata]|uniref:apolipoprotein D-like n=1 Tax=Diorhabda sublineata TaxID=1163346 RepID=UPI0024E11E0D|nr:apolipoprotein D-like [Diorhabda sublineata]